MPQKFVLDSLLPERHNFKVLAAPPSRASRLCTVSCPRGHSSRRKLTYENYIEIRRNLALD